MKHVSMFYLPGCPYCQMAELLLENKGVKNIEKIKVDPDPALRDEVWNATGSRNVPQIFIGATHVGGLDELSALDDEGKLDDMLKQD